MARIRTIKPAFFSSLSNADLPKSTRLTWIGLWTHVDDKGRAVDDARLVKAAVWPLDDDYTTKKVEADLVILEKAGKIGRYVVDGRRYLAVMEWRHQRIDKPQPSTLPPAPWEECFKNVPGTIPDDDGNDPGATPPKDGGEVEGKGSGKESSSSAAPQEHSRNGSADDDDDDDESRRSKAKAIIVDRRIGFLSIPPKNPAAYRKSVDRSVDEEAGDQIDRLVLKGLSSQAIADAVEPMPVAAPSSPAHQRWEPSETDEAPADPDVARARLAEMAAGIGRRVG